MTTLTISIIVVFVLGYALIATESLTKVNKAAIALLMLVGCWTLYMVDPMQYLQLMHPDYTGGAAGMVEKVTGIIQEHLGDTATTLFFLMGAMTIVEIVDQNGGFNWVRKVMKTKSKRALLWRIAILTFFLSAILDNLTTSIVMIRLKGYYRSYQTNDSVMKYFNDGIVEYYINLKNGKTDLNAYSKRNLHNSRLVSEDKKRAFMVSDKGTFRPWPEEKTLIEQYRKKYQLKDSLGSQLVLLNQQTIGSIQTDSSRNICQIEINQLPTYKNLTHQLFGYTQTDIYDHVVETYQISPEDYYSFKDLLFQKSDNSYLFSHKKDKQQQLIHVITELYITEKEYVEKKQSIKPDSSTPKESAAAITDFCIRNKIPSLPEATEQEMQQLIPYNPANMKEIKE